MHATVRYTPGFYGTRRYCEGPSFATRDAALRWIARNAHRIVEDVSITPSNGSETEWLHATNSAAYYLTLQSTATTA